MKELICRIDALKRLDQEGGDVWSSSEERPTPEDFTAKERKRDPRPCDQPQVHQHAHVKMAGASKTQV